MIEHDVAYGLEKAIELAPNDGCPITLTIGECDSLVSRLRQAEKDAARYRWLKQQPWFESEAEWCMPVNMDADGYEFSASIDQVIDEAMQCNK